jgi:alkylhydroperoxidase family enzyme
MRTGGRAFHIFQTLGRHKRLFRPWLMFAGRLMPGGKLPRTESELVILRTAINCRVRYEWEQHCWLGRKAGLTADEVQRVRGGSEAEGWSERQAAILAAVDELHAERFLSDPVWDRLAAQLSPEECLEVCMLTGHYEMLAMTLNSAGVQIEPALLKSAPKS